MPIVIKTTTRKSIVGDKQRSDAVQSGSLLFPLLLFFVVCVIRNTSEVFPT